MDEISPYAASFLAISVGIIIKAQQTICWKQPLAVLLRLFMRGIPITEAQIIVFALGACDHHKADFGVLGQLYTAVRAGLEAGWLLQVKYSRGPAAASAPAHSEYRSDFWGCPSALKAAMVSFDFRVENGCFRVFLFRHGFVPHFNFIALMASPQVGYAHQLQAGNCEGSIIFKLCLGTIAVSKPTLCLPQACFQMCNAAYSPPSRPLSPMAMVFFRSPASPAGWMPTRDAYRRDRRQSHPASGRR